MKCPACESVDLTMSERQGVEIDYCPKCRGVWLDRGELDKIIERSEERSAAQQPEQYDRRASGSYDDRQYVPRKRKKSFLGEILDFD